MIYNKKYKAFCLAALLLSGVTAVLSACNPFQMAKEAKEARKTSDSILIEFNKVNEDIKRSDSLFKAANNSSHRYYDSLLDKAGGMPISDPGHKGVGAIK